MYSCKILFIVLLDNIYIYISPIFNNVNYDISVTYVVQYCNMLYIL